MSWSGTIDQTRLPWVAVVGEPAERVLGAADFEEWARLRAVACGHTGDMVLTCKVCRGTLAAIEAFSAGAEWVKLYPAV